MTTNLDLTPELRTKLLDHLLEELETYYEKTEELRVTPNLDLEKIIGAVRSFDLRKPVKGEIALDAVLNGLIEHTVHTPHPMYYGLYNPRANFAGILADLITAVLNPQLAAWSHSPYANEVERYLVETFGLLFGYPSPSIDGVFASGGAEANFTAILCALNHAFPEVGEKGIQGISKKPLIYCSEQTHHSIQKGARMAGLGSASIRTIEVDKNLKMSVDKLTSCILEDKKKGFAPIMVVATAGTTGTGTIDHLEEIGKLCEAHQIWYHVDAAYGGATVVNPELKQWIKGIETSHSLIVDLHKWFSVPMATSLFITQDSQILHRTFRIQTGYMPKDAVNLEITDPVTHSFQWSRRFSGLKIYLSLLLYGMEGYADVIGNQVEMGGKLRTLLNRDGWTLKNHTPLPVLCFTDTTLNVDPGFTKHICDTLVKSGEAWISIYPIGQEEVLRACITNYHTDVSHLTRLVKLLGNAREAYKVRI